MTIPLFDRATEAQRFIMAEAGQRSPRVAIVLGSGLSDVAQAVRDAVEIPYQQIPHFVQSTVEGHAGKLILGECGGVEVAVMKGRFHFYEGYSMEEITLPIRAFSLLGIRSLILTNAAGSIDKRLAPGSLMIISDHLNLMGENPLLGPNDARFGPRFPDMTEVYSDSYIALALEAAKEIGLELPQGVYAGLRGPTYETPAEVRMLRTLGADAVGMSTVPEAIVARHSGISVLAFSCLTNYAAGLSDAAINHEDVIEIGKAAGKKLAELILKIVPRLHL